MAAEESRRRKRSLFSGLGARLSDNYTSYLLCQKKADQRENYNQDQDYITRLKWITNITSTAKSRMFFAQDFDEREATYNINDAVFEWDSIMDWDLNPLKIKNKEKKNWRNGDLIVSESDLCVVVDKTLQPCKTSHSLKKCTSIKKMHR